MAKKILMISQTVFPPDIRLEKEIRTLNKAGYEICVVCNQYEKNRNPHFETHKIERVNAIFSSKKLNKIFNFPIFFNPRYLFKIFRVIVSFRPNYIHCHDLPMVPFGIIFSRLFHLPLVFDMHENYPEALKEFQKKGIINFLFKNYRFAKFLELICLKFSNRVIVVIEENKNRLIKMGYESSNIFVVSNTIDFENFLPDKNIDDNFNYEFKDKPIILYTGTVSADRDLLTAINAVKYFPELGIDADMIIIGDGDVRAYLIEHTEKSGLNNRIKFISWPGHRVIPKFIEKAKICMIPQPNNDAINTTIPHKLFEYMYMSKPVIVSDAIPIKRIVDETLSGVSFKSRDSYDFALKIKSLFENKIDYGANGRGAVLRKYNWQREARQLLNLYKSFNNFN